ncbi:MAG: hypothetical protein KDN19_17275 [Verrucomicrobiae bacterium]|nr:hypothetical protein [Verrucomicrobiae bacterium]
MNLKGIHRPAWWWVAAAGLALISCSDTTEKDAPREEAVAEKPAPEAVEEKAAPESPIEVHTGPAEPEPAEKPAAPEKKAAPKDAAADEGMAMPEIVGVESPIDTDIRWTAYYIAPVTKTEPEEGRTLTFTDLAGKKIRYTVTGKSFHRAEMEAVAVGIDKDGKKRFGYRVSEGVWRELPEGSMGMGNKVNALVPLVHIAADQGTYPYGSLVHVPDAVGFEFGDGKKMNGYFWVADSGGRIEGDHFDLFVGQSQVYSGFLDTVKHQHHQTTIYPLPKVEKAWDPRNNAGLARVLIATGHLSAPAGEEKVGDEILREAVVGFQKDQPFIPAAEYGDPDAATTLWFLTQAAIQEKQKAASESTSSE